MWPYFEFLRLLRNTVETGNFTPAFGCSAAVRTILLDLMNGTAQLGTYQGKPKRTLRHHQHRPMLIGRQLFVLRTLHWRLASAQFNRRFDPFTFTYRHVVLRANLTGSFDFELAKSRSFPSNEEAEIDRALLLPCPRRLL